jgi:hypothetical protein
MRSRARRYVWHVQAIEATALDRGCERDGRTRCQGVRGWQSLERRDRVPQGKPLPRAHPSGSARSYAEAKCEY